MWSNCEPNQSEPKVLKQQLNPNNEKITKAAKARKTSAQLVTKETITVTAMWNIDMFYMNE